MAMPTGIGALLAVIVLVVDVALLAVGHEPLPEGLMIAGLAVARLT